MANRWRVVGEDKNEIPRIDIDSARRESQWQVYAGSRKLAAILAAILVFAGTVSTSLTIAFLHQRHELLDVLREKRTLEKRVSIMTATSTSLVDDQNAWRTQTERYAERHGWGDLVYSIAAAVPPNVYLDDVEVSGRTADSPIHLTGSGESVSDAREFAERLALSPVIADPVLTETSSDKTGASDRVMFTMVASGQTPLSSESGSDH